MERLTERTATGRAVFAKKASLFERAMDLPAIMERLAAYEDTGLEPEEIQKLAAAKKDGRLVVLPCKNEPFYTIEENYFNCEACEHKGRARYRPNIQRVACDMGVRCPLYIAEHICQGFSVSFDEDGGAVLSAPCVFGIAGLVKLSGIDDKWYPTREEAEAALEAQKGGDAE